MRGQIYRIVKFGSLLFLFDVVNVWIVRWYGSGAKAWERILSWMLNIDEVPMLLWSMIDDIASCKLLVEWTQ